MIKVLDGKKVATETEESLKNRVQNIKKIKGFAPALATILVGNDPASATYVKMKGNACERVGMNSIKVELPDSTSTEELLTKIYELNENPQVSGILLQHPVPGQINERACFDAIDSSKDVDGVTCLGFGNMLMGEEAFGSCTPQGIMRLLDYYEIKLEGKHAVVIGRSPILGKPMAMMLLNKNAWLKVGGYDEQFRTNGEDVHFCTKLRINGFKISYDSKPFCYHLQNDNLQSLLDRCWRYYVSGTGLKKPTYKRLLLRSIKHFKYCLINLSKDLINFRFSIIDIHFRVLFNYIKMEYRSCKNREVKF